MILSAKALLAEHPDPTEAEVREALAGNFCRCTGYLKPVEAVLAAARVYRTQAAKPQQGRTSQKSKRKGKSQSRRKDCNILQRGSMRFYSFQIVIEKEPEDEGYFAYSPTVPGCFSNGKTIEEARRNMPGSC